MKTDHDLILEYIQGDKGSIETLIGRHIDEIYSYLTRLLKDSDLAGEITQETFVKMWKNIHTVDTSKNFKSWLYTIARNTALDHLRKKKNSLFSELYNEDSNLSFEESVMDPAPLPDELFLQKEIAVTLENALQSVSMQEREVILLRIHEGLTFEEIGEVLNKPMNTVKSLYARGLSKLRKVIMYHAPK